MAYPSSVDLASLGAIFNLKALHTVLWALSFGINIWNGVVGVNAFKAIRPSLLPALLLVLRNGTAS